MYTNVSVVNFPPEFDPEYYQSAHSDLADLSLEQLRAHYYSFGKPEGRWATPFMGRESFLELVADRDSVLEVGPFFAPSLLGSHISYFDVLDRAGLVARAERLGHPPDGIPTIDFVSSVGDLTTVSQKFDAVFSSHCIEHQPNLIKHLNDVEALLQPGGSYFLIIPDKRYCFDHFLAAITIASVLEADDGRSVHSVRSVIEHRALITHNDALQHWQGNHGETPWSDTTRSERVKLALDEHQNSGGDYIDVHAWQFTPHDFRRVMFDLHNIGKIGLFPERVYATPHGRLEFCAILKKHV